MSESTIYWDGSGESRFRLGADIQRSGNKLRLEIFESDHDTDDIEAMRCKEIKTVKRKG